MSTKRPKPELSAHFLRELRVLEGKDYVQYKARTKELALPDDYKVYHYEPAAAARLPPIGLASVRWISARYAARHIRLKLLRNWQNPN